MLRLANLIAELEKRTPELLVEYDRVWGGDREGEYEIYGMATRALCETVEELIEPSRQSDGLADAASESLIEAALALFNEMAESSDSEVAGLVIEVLEEFSCHPVALEHCVPLMKPPLRDLLRRVGTYMRLPDGLDQDP
jgi:hypothetical protein